MKFNDSNEDDDLAMSVDRFAAERKLMVKCQIQERGVHDRSVLKAMESVPRHEFVLKDERNEAYHDKPLSIGCGQTISQPYIVAFMTGILDLCKKNRVLEIGTGSGYQAAVLSLLVKDVFTLEIVKPLGMDAAERFCRLGYRNVNLRIADGYNGWEEHAPYDAIIVTAAPGHVPKGLVSQLKNGGKMVVPVGDANATQILRLISKDIKGRVTEKELLAVRFVPFTGASIAAKVENS